MKRRKRIWIAGAVLIAVLALCAFALLYRPVPFRFLQGSRYVKTVTFNAPRGDFSNRRYIMCGTVESIKGRVAAELTAVDGWSFNANGEEHVTFFNADSPFMVTITTKLGGSAFFPKGEPWVKREPGTIDVIVASPPTIADRILVWLESR